MKDYYEHELRRMYFRMHRGIAVRLCIPLVPTAVNMMELNLTVTEGRITDWSVCVALFVLQEARVKRSGN